MNPDYCGKCGSPRAGAAIIVATIAGPMRGECLCGTRHNLRWARIRRTRMALVSATYGFRSRGVSDAAIYYRWES